MKYQRIVLILLTTIIVLVFSALCILKLRPPLASADPQAGPAVARAADLGSTLEDCDSIVDIARDLQKRRAAGLTEDQALAELSARGKLLLGFVVEEVFRSDPATSETVVLHAIWQKCIHSGHFGSAAGALTSAFFALIPSESLIFNAPLVLSSTSMSPPVALKLSGLLVVV